jgi:hypothetical protein
MITVVTVRPVENVADIFNNGGYLCAENYVLYNITVTNL